MIAYQLHAPPGGGQVVDFIAMDDKAARSFAASHCFHADCEVWDGDRLVHRQVAEARPDVPLTGLAPPKTVG